MKKSIFLFLAVTALACNKIDNTIDRLSRELTISVTTDTPTKSRVTGTELTSGSSIGVTLQQNGAATYDGLSYTNIKCTANGSGASQVWNPEKNMLLSATAGTLYGYYPYSSSVTALTSIPVETSSQTDYMYATPVGSLNNRNSNASLTMKHALAAICVSTVRGTYTGTGTVSSISVKGSNLATGAKMDATTGALSTFTGANTAIGPAISTYTLSTTARDNEIIVIPTGTSAAITISVTIDGQVFTATTSAADLAEGTITKYTVTANSGTLTIQSVNISTWTTASGGSLNLTV